MFFDIEKFYDSACLYKLVDHAMARDFPRRLLFFALASLPQRADPSCGRMVGQSIQPSNGILAGCSLGNRFAKVIFYKIWASANNVLPAQLPAPVETRQFVDGLATMSAGNNEDDVTRSICSIALELRHELEARRRTRNLRLRTARRRGSRVKVLARKNREAVKLYTTGIWWNNMACHLQT